MTANRTTLPIVLASLILTLAATSAYSANSKDFYIFGGLANWWDLNSASIFSPTSLDDQFRSSTWHTSSRDTTLRFGGGYAFSGMWAAEASVVIGLQQELSYSSNVRRLFPDDLLVDSFHGELKASILRVSPVLEYPVHQSVSLTSKAGVALIRRETRTLAEGDRFGSVAGNVTIQAPEVSRITDSTTHETNLFASFGLKFNFKGGASAATLSFTNYFDTPDDIKRALELDFRWNF